MKKILVFLLASTSLMAAPKAVVFDYGDVLAFPDRNVVVRHMCQTFQLTVNEFEKLNLERKISGLDDVDFWLAFAQERRMHVPENWPEIYRAAVKESMGADDRMYAIIDELKENNIRVGLLSNIIGRWAKMIRDCGLYEPFDPCLLSYDIDVAKPNPKAYHILIERIGLQPDEIVFFDDKLKNIEAAKELGIDAILFESPDQVRKDLEARELLKSTSITM